MADTVVEVVNDIVRIAEVFRDRGPKGDTGATGPAGPVDEDALEEYLRTVVFARTENPYEEGVAWNDGGVLVFSYGEPVPYGLEDETYLYDETVLAD